MERPDGGRARAPRAHESAHHFEELETMSTRTSSLVRSCGGSCRASSSSSSSTAVAAATTTATAAAANFTENRTEEEEKEEGEGEEEVRFSSNKLPSGALVQHRPASKLESRIGSENVPLANSDTNHNQLAGDQLAQRMLPTTNKPRTSGSSGPLMCLAASGPAKTAATSTTARRRVRTSMSKWEQRPRPAAAGAAGAHGRRRFQETSGCAPNLWRPKEVFLSKMPSPSSLARIANAASLAVFVVSASLCVLVANTQRSSSGDVHAAAPAAAPAALSAANLDLLLTALPPFSPTRRPLSHRLLHLQTVDSRGPVAVRHERLVEKMPNKERSNGALVGANDQKHHQRGLPGAPSGALGQEPATAASSASGSKFTRTNELEGFLDEMDHKELQTVAAGRPIEDLFQPRPFRTATSPLASQNHMRPAQAAAHHHQQDRRAAAQEPAPSQPADGGGGGGGAGGLMASHSEQQIYSDCALILQRTYVKNIDDPKHQMVPFGKTEQACISYKHLDKAVEQAKHKLKFREFAKMRKKAAAAVAAAGAEAGAGGQEGQAPPPPAPLEVIHSSLEPPEDLVAAIGEINMATTQIIADQFDLSNDELLNGLPLIDMSKTKLWPICPLLVKQDLKCEMGRFRTFTGHCNNLKHPTWGAAKTPYARYLPPVHLDGIWLPRQSVVGELTNDGAFGAPGAEHSMPAPMHHTDDNEFARRQAGHSNGGGGGGDDEESAELAHQADAELMRELRDDGSHMDMAGSVHFVRRAPHPLHGGPPPPPPAVAHHGPLAAGAAALAAASQAHARHAHYHAHLRHAHAHVHPHAHAQQLPGSMSAASAPLVHQHHRAHARAHELPSARLVSSVAHRDVDAPNHEFTMLFMSWGQLLDHDMTRAASPPNSIKCCPGPNGEPASKHKLCLPIEVPSSDPFYSQFGVQCLDFRRTLAGVRPNCVLGPRVHQNANTAPIDANFVYGSSQATADALRLFKGGRLRDRDWFRQEGLKPLLPAQEIDPDLSCLGRPRDLFCFLAGDLRVNEQTHLTVLHTLYMREHNRIADKLSELNPHWDDERTFQETRHLVAAGVQHVLINEYIPLLIGRKMSQLYNLTLASSSTAAPATTRHHAHAHHLHAGEQQQQQQTAAYWHGYDPTVTTSVSNSFAAAAFRQGHTFVQSTIDRFNKFHEFVASEKLRHLFMRPFLLYQPGVMDELVGGMINSQSQSYDPFMTEELAGHLFQPPEAQFGHDLAAINLQRGRDQGLPGYNLFREWCGLPRAETFQQLEPYLTNHTAYLYSKLYKHVDDIDLWSAGIAERKLPGAAIGPTFSCIIARQFSNTRRGDRFWYENPGFPSSFTPDQLTEIKKFTLAKLICTNADDLPTIQRWAFRLAHPVLNPRVECSQLPEIDLQYWQEE